MGNFILGIIGVLASISGLFGAYKLWDPKQANYVRARLIGFIASLAAIILVSIYYIIKGYNSL